MKKILSLLSMLMITVMAFATDYKGQLDYTVTTRTGDLTGPSNAQGVLKIEPYAGVNIPLLPQVVIYLQLNWAIGTKLFVKVLKEQPTQMVLQLLM